MEKLQKQIQEVAKKTGISSAAKLALVTKKEEFESKYIPDIEWWDMALLPNHTYKDLDRTLGEGEERFVGIFFFFYIKFFREIWRVYIDFQYFKDLPTTL